MSLIWDLVKVEQYAETKKIRKILQTQLQPPKNTWQRMPDGSQRYLPTPAPETAYEQGWREGWTAGYAAAMEKMKEV